MKVVLMFYTFVEIEKNAQNSINIKSKYVKRTLILSYLSSATTVIYQTLFH